MGDGKQVASLWGDLNRGSTETRASRPQKQQNLLPREGLCFQRRNSKADFGCFVLFCFVFFPSNNGQWDLRVGSISAVSTKKGLH